MRIFSVEFSVLGLLAGAVGVVFANLLTRVLLHRVDIGFHIAWGATLTALPGTGFAGYGYRLDSPATVYSACDRLKCSAKNKSSVNREERSREV